MSRGNGGFTLLELVISIAIATLVFIGLAEGLALSIDANLRTALSDEAAVVGENKINEIRSTPFDAITTANFPPETVTRMLRRMTVSYAVTTTVTPLDADLRQVDVRVGWSRNVFRIHQYDVGTNSSHAFSTIVRRNR